MSGFKSDGTRNDINRRVASGFTRSRSRIRVVKRVIRLTCIFSALLYLVWGCWPLLEYLTFERNRRDFCGPLHDSGTSFSIACLVSSVLLLLSFISFTLCTRCSVVPLLVHIVTFIAATGFTIQASIFLWLRTEGTTSLGELCKLESAIFYSGAELYTKVSLLFLKWSFFVSTIPWNIYYDQILHMYSLFHLVLFSLLLSSFLLYKVNFWNVIFRICCGKLFYRDYISILFFFFYYWSPFWTVPLTFFFFHIVYFSCYFFDWK